MAFGSPFSRRNMFAGAAALGVAATLGRFTKMASAQTAGSVTAAPSLPRGEFIVRGAYLITVDPQLGEISNGDIHVRNGAIVAVGRNLQAPGAQVIDAKGMIALPGFVDTHWHMWGAVARNLSGHTENSGYYFVSRLIGQFFTAQDNARGVRLALAEGIYSGLTTFTNWSHNLLGPEYADAEIAEHIAAGARARFAYGYSRKTPSNATLPLEDVARVQKQYFAGKPVSADGLLSLGIAPRGPENNDIDICRKEWAFAREHGIGITCHMGTNAKRVSERQGVQTLHKAGLLGPDVVLIHDTNNSPEDLKILAETKTPVSLSPYTELRTGFGITPVTNFLKAGVPVGLSIDTTILSGNADMFAVMKALENIANGVANSEFAISSEKLIEMATMGGARALKIDDKVGSLTPGKRADFMLVRTTDINMMPFTVPSRMIVQAAQPHNIDSVVVDGKFLKKDGKLTTIDVPKLAAEAAETIERARVEASKPGSDAGIREELLPR